MDIFNPEIGLIGSGVIGKDSSKVVDYAYEKMSKFDTNKVSPLDPKPHYAYEKMSKFDTDKVSPLDPAKPHTQECERDGFACFEPNCTYTWNSKL